MNRGLLVLMLGLGGCLSSNAGECHNAIEALCETCPKNDYNNLYCKCMADGELTLGDFDDVQQVAFGVETNEDAQKFCDEAKIDADHVTEEEGVYCAETNDYLDLYGADACEDLGWED